jgi:hypothetical protein
MSEPFYWVLGISIATATGALFAARDVLFKKDCLPKVRISRAGYGLLVCSLALIIFPCVLYKVQNASDKKERDDRDSVLRKDYFTQTNKQLREYDSSVRQIRKDFGDSNNRTLTVIGQTLAKYGLRLDTNERRLTKLITDSGNMKTVLPNQPVLDMGRPGGQSGFEYLKFENGLNHYAISFMSLDGASCCYDLKISAAVVDSASTGMWYKGPVQSGLTPTDVIETNAGYKWTFAIDNTVQYESLFIWVRGNYKSRDGSHTYLIDKLYYNRKTSNSWGQYTGRSKKTIISVINANEK